MFKRLLERVAPLMTDDQGYVLDMWRAIGPLEWGMSVYSTGWVAKYATLWGYTLYPFRYIGWKPKGGAL